MIKITNRYYSIISRVDEQHIGFEFLFDTYRLRSAVVDRRLVALERLGRSSVVVALVAVIVAAAAVAVVAVDMH